MLKSNKVDKRIEKSGNFFFLSGEFNTRCFRTMDRFILKTSIIYLIIGKS